MRVLYVQKTTTTVTTTATATTITATAATTKHNSVQQKRRITSKLHSQGLSVSSFWFSFQLGA